MFIILRKFLGDSSGVSSIEYALIASIISIAAFGAYQLIGTTVASKIQPVASALN
jgi:pilus assembly protein Flp/PilA